MPTKRGLDWFPFDVDLLDCEELDFLRNEHGFVVNDIYISLLTLLYRKEGYYIPYSTDKDKKNCVWYIIKHTRGGKHPVKQEAIPTVIEQLVACGLFSGDLFCKIITSERAQRTYYSATVERKLESFDIRPEYWLLSDDTMRKLSQKHPYYLSLHPKSKSTESDGKSDELDSKSDELDVDKIRVDSKKEIYNTTLRACACENIIVTAGDLPNLIDREQADYEWQLINDYIQQDINSLGYEVWIKPLTALGYSENGTLYLKTATTASQTEVNTRYLNKLKIARMRVREIHKE